MRVVSKFIVKEGYLVIYHHNENKIETNQLMLRLFNEVDVPEVVKLCNNYNLYKSTLNLPYPYLTEHALIWMENHLSDFNHNKRFELAITDKITGKLYGAIALSHHQTFNHGELAYWIGEEYWGNGYATEAAKALIEFAFSAKNYNKVFARSFDSNPASMRVIEKTGMKKEGLLKQHVRKDGKYIDLVCYGILKQQADVLSEIGTCTR